MALGIPGNILLGLGLLRGGFRPRFAAWVILLDLPLSIGLVAISTQALGMWTMTLAWAWSAGPCGGTRPGTTSATPVPTTAPSPS